MITYRPARTADNEFINNGWVTSYRLAHAAGIIPMARWRDVMWPVIEHIRAREYVKTLVADDDGTLYGFVTYEDPTDRQRWRNDSAHGLDQLPYVHYAYTKEFRRRGRKTFGAGVLTELLRAAGIDPSRSFGFACKTPSVAQLIDAGKIPGARWDPLRARYERDYEQRMAR